MEARENESVATQVIVPAIKLRDWFRHDIQRPLENLVGGRKRLRVVALLACVLALDAADKATVGAVAAQLEHDLHIGNLQIGLLVAVSTGISALTTLPFGALVDRVHRGKLLTIAIALWSLAMIAAGASVSYSMLLITRLGLGAVVAIASPAIASLTGDFFHPAERGRIYGYILAGELVGVAFGFLISGNVAAILSWRASFWILAFLGLILAVMIAKLLPEPRRGGQNPIPDRTRQQDPARSDVPENEVEEIVEERDIEPREEQILHSDPLGMSVWDAVRYVLSIPTYRTLIIASALGYFYFTGLRTFAIVFVRGRFDLAQATASTFSVGVGLGAIVGVLVAGTLADKMIDRGKLTGRILVGAGAYLLAAAALVPGLFATSLWVASPFFFLAAAGLGGANPAVDAARLDIMHSRLWGRAEGVRSTLLYIFQAIAPPLFGWVSGVFGGSAGFGGNGSPAQGHASNGAGGLDITFLIMLVTLAAAGLVMFRALKTYPRDVATAIASEQAAPQKEESRDRNDRRG
jgi:MFS family permease